MDTQLNNLKWKQISLPIENFKYFAASVAKIFKVCLVIFRHYALKD